MEGYFPDGKAILRYFSKSDSYFFLTFFAAVKCNPNPGVLHTLARLGTGFDCASKQEMDTILGMGIDQSRIIFANPCKMDSHISHAREVSVKR